MTDVFVCSWKQDCGSCSTEEVRFLSWWFPVSNSSCLTSELCWVMWFLSGRGPKSAEGRLPNISSHPRRSGIRTKTSSSPTPVQHLTHANTDCPTVRTVVMTMESCVPGGEFLCSSRLLRLWTQHFLHHRRSCVFSCQQEGSTSFSFCTF